MGRDLVISFPHIGNYYAPIRHFLQAVFPYAKVIPAPATTNKTLELGGRNSPDYVCSPFKFNMGNYIEALNNGANVLLQTGIGCRYGYFGELQEQILRDMGYEFEFVCLSRGNARPGAVYKRFKKLGSPLSPCALAYQAALALKSIRVMDAFEDYIRENIGFEIKTGSFDAVYADFLDDLGKFRSVGELLRLKRKYKKAFAGIETDKPDSPPRVGVIGELYTVMDGFSNFDLERRIAKYGITVSRPMSVSFLVLGKHDRSALRKARGYLRFAPGANGVDSVAWCKGFAQGGYDGVIHIKSFGCTPELSAMPALMRISRDYDMPVLHLSFDSHTSETGVVTRLEAFCDMIEHRRALPGRLL